MFWSCFSYDQKGPCHIWEDKTAKEKKEAKKWIEEVNALLEPECKANQELETAIRRLNVRRNVGGPKPKWRFTEKTGRLERKASRGGIDWYWYYKVILEGKLLPFAKRCKLTRPGTIVQEDNASPHTYKHQQRVYNLQKIIKLLWPSNSPNLNAIKKCQFQIKRQTTKHSVALSVKQIKKDQEECQARLP